MATRKPRKSAPAPRRGPLTQRAEISADSRAFPRMKEAQVPRRGWIRAIRDALGVSQSALGARAGISRATVQQMERAEGRRRITLASLDRLANAMGCQIAFAIVPRGGTLEDVRRRQAKLRAEELLAEKLAASQSAAPRPRELELRKERLANKLLRGSPRKLWAVPGRRFVDSRKPGENLRIYDPAPSRKSPRRGPAAKARRR